MTDFELSVNGTVFTAWKSVTIIRSLEQLAAGFNAVVGNTEDLAPGMVCTAKARSAGLFSGYIDSVTEGYTGTTHETSIKGRSKVADLIDCSAVVKGGQFLNQPLEQIARSLATPFGISVLTDRLATQGPVFGKFAVQESETCYEVITRAAKASGAVVTSNDDGNLTILTSFNVPAATTLRRGENINYGNVTRAWDDRFSTYTIKSQNAGSDTHSGKAAAWIKGTADDAAVTRRRPLVIVSDTQLSTSAATTRAKWERNNRAGKAVRVTYNINTWVDGAGVWTPGRLVQVDDDLLDITDELLIASVTLTKSAAGEAATLDLVRPEAFDVLASPPPKRGKDGFLQW